MDKTHIYEIQLKEKLTIILHGSGKSVEVISVEKIINNTRQINMHSHSCWELLYNSKGVSEIKLEDDFVVLRPRDVVIIPPELLHEKVSEGDFEDFCLLVRQMRPIGDDKLKIISDDKDHNVQTLLEMAVSINRSEEHNGAARRSAILNAIAEAIYQLLGSNYAKGEKRDLRIEKFLERLQMNITNPLFNLSDEVERIGYSKGYFRKVFKEATGESPVVYFNTMRIDYAKHQFSFYGNSRSIKDVAFSCGFTDPYYFSRVFKNIAGISPKEFVEQVEKG